AFSRYRVRSGDNLGRIARRARVSTRAIMEANGISDPRRLRVGRVIRIPLANSGSGSTKASMKREGSRYRVRSGDNLGRIAKRYGVAVKLLMDANGINNPRRLKVGKILAIPSGAQNGHEPGVLKYKVRPGDSLYMLSRRWGVAVEDILAANREVKIRRLRVGTTLIVPLGNS
ncbi:MAG: LysM peptidoglycan-binding domain-containing protein, partial [Thermodesulfobacteriota bacterium]